MKGRGVSWVENGRVARLKSIGKYGRPWTDLQQDNNGAVLSVSNHLINVTHTFMNHWV